MTSSPAPPLPTLFRAQTVGSSLTLYLPTTAVARLTGLLRGVLLAWLMTEAQFGLLQIALLVVGILYPLCGAGLPDVTCGSSRSAASVDPNGRDLA